MAEAGEEPNLAQVTGEADVDAHTVREVLDGIPGAFERALAGAEQARSHLAISLDEI